MLNKLGKTICKCHLNEGDDVGPALADVAHDDDLLDARVDLARLLDVLEEHAEDEHVLGAGVLQLPRDLL